MGTIVAVVIVVVSGSIMFTLGFIIGGNRGADSTTQCTPNNSALSTIHLVTQRGADSATHTATNRGLEG